MTQPDDWEIRVERAWSTASTRPDGEVFDELARLADERDAEDPMALYELASAHDYVGREADAVPLYRQALAQGLHGSRRPRALLQLARATARKAARASVRPPSASPSPRLRATAAGTPRWCVAAPRRRQ